MYLCIYYRKYPAVRKSADYQLHVPYVWRMFHKCNTDSEWFIENKFEGKRHIGEWWIAAGLKVPEEYKEPEAEPVKQNKNKKARNK